MKAPTKTKLEVTKPVKEPTKPERPADLDAAIASARAAKARLAELREVETEAAKLPALLKIKADEEERARRMAKYESAKRALQSWMDQHTRLAADLRPKLMKIHALLVDAKLDFELLSGETWAAGGQLKGLAQLAGASDADRAWREAGGADLNVLAGLGAKNDFVASAIMEVLEAGGAVPYWGNGLAPFKNEVGPIEAIKLQQQSEVIK